MTAPWAIKRTDIAQRRQVEGQLGGGGVGSSPPPGDAAQGDQWKTAVNGNNCGSGRALDNENVDGNDHELGGGGPALMIVDEDDQAGVATGGDNEGNCLRSRLICDDGIGLGAGVRRSIHGECIVTFLFQSITISFRVN